MTGGLGRRIALKALGLISLEEKRPRGGLGDSL